MSELIFEIADTFVIDLARVAGRKVGALTGNAVKRVDVVPGLDWVLYPRVVDSIADNEHQKAAAVLHVGGDLYLALVVDGFQRQGDGYATIWVLDGTKLKWSESPTPVTAFPGPGWDRCDYYEQILPGVVTAYRRSKSRAKWSEWKDVGHEMWAYVHDKKLKRGERKETENTSSLNVYADKFRTKGPRDLQ